MNSVVFDASAILAYLHDEAGSDVAARYLDAAIVSAVNIAEVATRLNEQGLSDGQVRQVVAALDVAIVPFDGDLAYRCAQLRASTRRRGLSLGDRACLALAQRQGAPVLTADQAWLGLDIGVEIRLIREPRSES